MACQNLFRCQESSALHVPSLRNPEPPSQPCFPCFRYVLSSLFHRTGTGLDDISPISLDCMFKAALPFFRTERGFGEQAKDVSTFFQLSKLDDRFAKFWNSARNPYRAKVEARLRKFRHGLSWAMPCYSRFLSHGHSFIRFAHSSIWCFAVSML